MLVEGVSLVQAFIRYFTYIYQTMLVFSPVLTLIYLMIGGMKFSVSSGNHEKVLAAKRTITSALIGAGIIFLAYPFLNYLGFVISPQGSNLHFLDWYADLVTMLALVYLAWGGVQYITSSGKPSDILEAKRTITYAIQGYVWMLIVRLVFSSLAHS